MDATSVTWVPAKSQEEALDRLVLALIVSDSFEALLPAAQRDIARFSPHSGLIVEAAQLLVRGLEPPNLPQTADVIPRLRAFAGDRWCAEQRLLRAPPKWGPPPVPPEIPADILNSAIEHTILGSDEGDTREQLSLNFIDGVLERVSAKFEELTGEALAEGGQYDRKAVESALEAHFGAEAARVMSYADLLLLRRALGCICDWTPGGDGHRLSCVMQDSVDLPVVKTSEGFSAEAPGAAERLDDWQTRVVDATSVRISLVRGTAQAVAPGRAATPSHTTDAEILGWWAREHLKQGSKPMVQNERETILRALSALSDGSASAALGLVTGMRGAIAADARRAFADRYVPTIEGYQIPRETAQTIELALRSQYLGVDDRAYPILAALAVAGCGREETAAVAYETARDTPWGMADAEDRRLFLVAAYRAVALARRSP